MRANALFDLLPDFGTFQTRAEPLAEPPHPPPVEEPPVDTDALVAEAVATATAELEARLAAEHQAALEAQRQAHAEEIEALVLSLGDDAGKKIASSLEALEERVVALISGQTARMLATVLAGDLQQRAMSALARTVREAMHDAEGTRVRVSGPASLYESLRNALGTHSERLEFAEAPGFDLVVTVDDAVFETRMAEWSQALSEILA